MENTLKIERIGSVNTDKNGKEYVMLYTAATVEDNVFIPSQARYADASFLPQLQSAFDSKKGLFVTA
tara:strand:- start:234 stop:434 length:201 start_codon:yes stop_codon:yes gene_type:complete